MSWRTINIDYPLHYKLVNNLIVIPPNWVYPPHKKVNYLIVFSTQLSDFDNFKAEKHPNLGNWANDYKIKIGLL